MRTHAYTSVHKDRKNDSQEDTRTLSFTGEWYTPMLCPSREKVWKGSEQKTPFGLTEKSLSTSQEVQGWTGPE